MFPRTPVSSTPRTSRRILALGGLLIAGALSAALSAPTLAGERAGHRDMPMHGERAGGPQHGAAGMPLPMLGGRHLERLLDEVQATDAQRTQIHQILDKARDDVRALHDGGQQEALRKQALALWAQPKLDAAAAEKLRQQMQAQHEQVSKRLFQASLDVGQVLTPAQRSKAAERIQAWHEQMKARFEHRAAEGAASGASAPGGLRR